MTQHVLILGATGRFGRHAAAAFWNAGWTVARHDRATGDLMAEAQAADVIVNAWNPRYDQWAAQVPAQTQQVITAAKASGATVIVPGNVYVYGAAAPDCFAADTPHLAKNALGQIRIKMEQAYRDAGVRTIILRAGDFIDTEKSGNWFDSHMITSLPNALTYPGATDAPHAWAYLPDVAQAAVMLAEKRANLPVFLDAGFAGYTLTGKQMAAALADVLGHNVRTKTFAWFPLIALQPFWKLARHLVEMRYVWNKPHHIDGSALMELIPEFIPTPLNDALRMALPDADFESSGTIVSA